MASMDKSADESAEASEKNHSRTSEDLNSDPASDRESDAEVSARGPTGKTQIPSDDETDAHAGDSDASNPVSVQEDTSHVSTDFTSDKESDDQGNDNLIGLQSSDSRV